jgi:cytochrome c-type biogenesis protein CcmH/NrfF
MRRLALALLAVALLLVPVAGASAAKPRASFSDVESEVMCDTCNVPLNVAESPRADQERREIRDLIAKGLTKDQIKAELARRYGPQILALPPDKGFSLTAYAVPIAVVAALLALAALVLPRWRRRGRASPQDGPAAGPEISAADAARLEADLARWDR